MVKSILRFVRDETAATAIEYGLIAALIAILIVTALTNTGTHLNIKLATIAATLR